MAPVVRFLRRPWAIGAILLCLIVASCTVIWALERADRLHDQGQAEAMSLRMFAGEVGAVLAHEHELTGILALQHGDVRPHWALLSRVVLDDPAASGIGFVVPVTERQRPGFERRTGIRILAALRPGILAPAPHRGTHWVLESYAQRPGRVAPRLGTDVASNPLRRDLLDRAVGTGSLEASPPVRFLNRGSGVGVQVVSAVRQAGRVRGWVIASYTPATLVSAVQAGVPRLRMRLSDGGLTLLSDLPSGAGRHRTVYVAGRTWTVSAALPAGSVGPLPWILLLVGTVVCAAVVALLRAYDARERRAQAEADRHEALEREALVELDAQRRELIEAQAIASVGSWTWEPAVPAARWSAEMYRIFGRDPADGPAVGGESTAMVHPEDRERFVAALGTAHEEAARFEVDYRVIRQGEIRHLYTRGRRDAAGCYVGTTQDFTELWLARSDAQAQRELAAQVIEAAHDAFVSCSADGRVIGWNAAAEEMFGYASEEALGRPMGDVVVPAHRGGSRDELLTGDQATNGASRSMTLTTRDGHELLAELTVTQTETPHGPVYTALIRDITERERRERERWLYSTIVEQTEDAVSVVDVGGIIREWNGSAERIYGFTAEEAIGSPASLVVPAHVKRSEWKLMRQVIAGQRRVVELETVRRRKGGALIDVATSFSPISAPDGKVLGMAAITRDITARKREQNRRRQIDEQLRVTVEHAPIGVALIELDRDHDGRIISGNEVLGSLLGVEDPAGRGLLGSVRSDDRILLRADLAELADGARERCEREVRVEHPDGRVSWLLVSGSTVPDEAGAPRQAVLHLMDIGERKRFEGQLQFLADHDSLTGLFNRRRFLTELERAVAHAERYGGRGAVLMIDLDGFKHVNDLMGHRHGDELVQRVAVLMGQVLRESDIVARLGGDEFAVILPEADRSQALMVSEKLLEVLRDRAIVLSESGHASVTGSIGVTAFAADTRLGAEELLVEADIAMYDAKENGRDQTSVFARETHSHGAQRPHVAWLERLQAAIREQRFELLAQPIRGLFPGSRDVFELLLRLRTIDGDLIPPGSFLPDAERFELIQQIDRWVFDRALHILAEQRAAGHDIVLSINMSGKTLGDPNILHDLGALIAECPVEPGRLIVEVTETAAITNIDKARVVARGLRDLGCRFALDDFGAGFASFYYLKHLDFDYLKIDGEFIRNLPQNPTDQLVVRSVVDIARGVGAQTVAEFVADEETVACLRELGVDYGQGYHLGRPQALEQLLAVPR